MKPAISIITPTVRPEGLVMVDKCLKSQTVQDWEWMISVPESDFRSLKIENPAVTILCDPPANPGDFYSLNKAWNNLIAHAKADLLVFVVDWIWFPKNSFEMFLEWFKEAPNLGVSGHGNHYRTVVNHKPEVIWEYDRRPGPKIEPYMMELAFASLPKADVLAVGGFDEEYDQAAGMSEKDLCVRMAKQRGNAFVLDDRIAYRNYTHPKSQSPEEWQAAEKAKHLFLASREKDKLVHGTSFPS